VLWANRSGSTLIVAWLLEWDASSAIHFGLISHGSYTPLPSPQGITPGTTPNIGRYTPDVAW
jgi:hypothetical protein